MTIELRGKTWTARLRIQDSQGRTVNRRVTLGTHPALRTRQQAEARLAQVEAQHQHRRRPGRRLTFAGYAHRYLARRVALMRPASRKQYRHLVRAYLLPHLGQRPLTSVDAEALQTMLLTLHRVGLARQTLANVRSAALNLLSTAALDGYPAPVINGRAVRLPKDALPAGDPRSFTVEEVAQLIAVAADDPPAQALYAVLGYAGLRIGEALGLRRQDLDLDPPFGPTVRIRQSVVVGRVQALKTRTSQADLPMLPQLVAVLRAYLPTPDAQRGTGGLLFSTRAGAPLRADYVRRVKLARDLKRSGVSPGGFHAFRHSLPRRLFDLGASPDVVRQLMRHSSLAMTQRYSHTRAEDLRAAVNRRATP